MFGEVDMIKLGKTLFPASCFVPEQRILTVEKIPMVPL